MQPIGQEAAATMRADNTCCSHYGLDLDRPPDEFEEEEAAGDEYLNVWPVLSLLLLRLPNCGAHMAYLQVAF